MAKYYYKKYSLDSRYSDSTSAPSLTSNDSVSGGSQWGLNGWTGEYSVSGSSTVTKTNGASCYHAYVGSMMEYYSNGSQIYSISHNSFTYNIKGFYIETIAAEDGTYPVDGEQGAYWYEKTTLAETVAITSPNGGETIQDNYTIVFTKTAALNCEISLSLDNGVSWKILGNSATTSLAYNFINEVESSQCLIRARLYDGANYGTYDQSDGIFTILHNIAPTAPTNLSPASSTINRKLVNRFSWKHNDTDNQSKFDFQWSSDGVTWNTITQNTINQFLDISVNVFPLGTIYWKVRTYDSYGVVSPYSSQASITSAEPSGAPTITSSSTVNVAKPVFTWSQADQIAYIINVLNSVNAVVWDSGEVASVNKAATCGANLVNGATYSIKVKTKNAAGLSSEFGVKSVNVTFIPPAKPQVSLQSDNVRGKIEIYITNPTPSGSQPVVVYNDVYKKVKGEFVRVATGVNKKYIDYTPKSSEIYEYLVKAIGSNGTYTDSSICQGSIQIEHSQLALTTDYSKWILLKLNPKRSESLQISFYQMHLAGRKKAVTQYEEFEDNSLPLSFALDNAGDLDILKDMIRARATLLYRDSRGRKLYGTIKTLSVDDEMINNVWTKVSFTIDEVDYSEVV